MKTIKVVAAIIIDNGKVFATQRGYGEFKDGWEFPGGKIEEGETARDARDSSRLSENTEDPRKFNIPWVFSFCQNLRICV